jgi:branched-chain amino acid transport system permease protein
VNVLSTSCFYVLFAVGMALVFGVMKVINFAHGEFYMLGGYALWILLNYFSSTIPSTIAFFIALVVGAPLVGCVGLLVERILFRPLRDNQLGGFMASMGLAYIIQVIAAKSFGVLDRSLPVVFTGNAVILGAIITWQRIVVVGFSILMGGGLWFLLKYTRIGRGLRATSQNREAALLQGIDFVRMSKLAMWLGSTLAAASGALMGSVINIGPFMGHVAIWKSFMIIIVGGMGSISGAILAALLFAFIDSSMMTYGLHRYVVMVDALIMLTVLAFRPVGLLGRERAGDSR